MSDELFELPEGWEWIALKEIADHVSGVAFKSSDFTTGGIQVIRLGNVYKGELNLGRDPVFLPEDFLVNTFVLNPGDIIVSQTGTRFRRDYGYFVSVPQNAPKLFLNQRLLAVRCHNSINSQYVVLASKLKSYQNHFFSHETGGVNQGNVGVAGVMEGCIPLAPLNEQKRIVAKIEELNDRHQRAKQALEAIPELCDRFRQSVLAAAFRGDLTADWREENPDIEPASVLLERIKTERFNNWKRNEDRKILLKGNQSEKIRGRKYVEPVTPDASTEITKPDSWLFVSADQITYLITDGKHGDCKDEPNSDYFFLSVKDLYEGKLHYENARQIQEQDFQEVHYRTNLEIGDVLVTNAGTIGRVAVARESDKVGRTTFQKSIAVLKPIKEIVQSDFLAMYIENSVSQLNKKSSGTAVKNLLLRDLKEFSIALPPIKEQIEIVRRVEELLAFADRLRASYQSAFLQFDRLNQSILAKAFRGELVEQDPNDEPASVLLDRIRAEREKLQGNKKSGAARGKRKKAVDNQLELPEMG